MNVKERLKDHPRKWDYAVMLTLLGMLVGAASYIIGAEVSAHNASHHAHPDIVEQIEVNATQLNSIEANQIRTQAMQIDALICKEPNNRFYRQELSRLISKWERLTDQNFPRELLRCV